MNYSKKNKYKMITIDYDESHKDVIIDVINSLNLHIFISSDFDKYAKLVYGLILECNLKIGFCNWNIIDIATFLHIGNEKVINSIAILQDRKIITIKPYCILNFLELP